MIEELKALANKRDIPYQSLMKKFLAERIEHELKSAIMGSSLGRLNWPNFSTPKLALKICSQSLILCWFQPVSKVPKNG
jgi:hypothetical protein